jgi:hypothetical protein
MIAATSLSGQPKALQWQQALADAITDPAELCAALGLDPALIAPALAAAHDFPNSCWPRASLPTRWAISTAAQHLGCCTSTRGAR